ncbi:MAG: flagellar filament capping protein FliD [Hungatella sp.]|nr:flagellar filament capping protein FliD [Hungatella sp.]
MAVNGVSSNMYGSYYTYNYGYNGSSNGINSGSWSDKANEAADQLKESLGISDTSKTDSSTKPDTSTKASSTSGFLMGYQTRLEDLEASADKLTLTSKNNVFDNLDGVKAKAEKGEADQEAVTKAEDEVYSAVKDLAKKYNDTISYLKKNTEFGAGLSNQLDSLKRAVPSEKTLKYLGMSYDTDGNLQVDEKKFKEVLQKDPEFVKGALGGQFGIAERLGSKATSILDSSVDKVIGSSSSGSTSGTEDKKNTSSAESVATYGTSSTKANGMNDSFNQFASFARSGAYNLSNYYAVSMLNILV